MKVSELVNTFDQEIYTEWTIVTADGFSNSNLTMDEVRESLACPGNEFVVQSKIKSWTVDKTDEGLLITVRIDANFPLT